MSYGIRKRLTNRESSGRLAMVAVACLIVAPFVLQPFQTSLLAETLIFAVFATAFNLL